MSFNELIRILEANGFRLAYESGSVRYYSKSGYPKVLRVDYHGSKEVPKGTATSTLKKAGIRSKAK